MNFKAHLLEVTAWVDWCERNTRSSRYCAAWTVFTLPAPLFAQTWAALLLTNTPLLGSQSSNCFDIFTSFQIIPSSLPLQGALTFWCSFSNLLPTPLLWHQFVQDLRLSICKPQGQFLLFSCGLSIRVIDHVPSETCLSNWPASPPPLASVAIVTGEASHPTEVVLPTSNAYSIFILVFFT